MGRALCSGFLDSAERFPDRPAIAIQDDSISYQELKSLSSQIAHTFAEQRSSDDHGRLTGVFGHRSFAAFAGVLGALFLGDGYVPLNPSFPPDRTLQMLNRSKLKRVVVEAQSFNDFLPIAEQLEEGIVIVVPDADHSLNVPGHLTRHHVLTGEDLTEELVVVPEECDSDSLAYLLFTSGSTGQPKGVMVTQQNVCHFVDVMTQRYEVTEEDRFSQTFDLTFDLSAFDMFVAWEKGACVCCPTQGQKLLPAKYVTSQNISIWFSVPSTAIMMKKLRMLKQGQYPSLRYSLFCGEALPLEVAEAFQQAAPISIVENLYGPTELTIACTLYRYDDDTSSGEAELGVVPIGQPYPGMSELIVDENLQPVADGEAGELLMTGPQISAGYWEDPQKTAGAFVVPPGQSDTYYRTGDRVKRYSAEAPLLYLGRVDNQIKVQGYRVELGEIEAVIRSAASTDTAIAAGYPEGINGAEGIVVFVSEPEIDLARVGQAVGLKLPAYMQPSSIVQVSEFPLNANGKVDRNALMSKLNAGDLKGERLPVSG